MTYFLFYQNLPARLDNTIETYRKFYDETQYALSRAGYWERILNVPVVHEGNSNGDGRRREACVAATDLPTLGKRIADVFFGMAHPFHNGWERP